MGVIEVEVPEGIPLKPLKKKIEELNLSESELEGLEEVRERVWKEEKKKLGL